MNIRNGRRHFIKRLMSLAGFVTGSLMSIKKTTPDGPVKVPPFTTSPVQAQERKTGKTGHKVKIIAVEEHVTTEKTLMAAASKIASGKAFDLPIPTKPSAHENAIFKEKRLEDMNAAGIDMQVLSPLPFHEGFDATEGVSMSEITNNELYDIVQKYPNRFTGLAGLAAQNPDGAAKELERSVRQLGLKGGIVYSNSKGEYLDGKKFWVIFETAEKLGVPIFLHPKEPSPGMIAPYQTYPGLAGAVWGYAAEAGLHAMRLIYSGLFDTYPKLKIILGHLGEGLPYWLWRMDSRSEGFPARYKPSYYVKNNFVVNTSGMFWPPAIEFACRAMGTDKVLFAVDYPSESNANGIQSINNLSLDSAEKEKIFHLNAERVFQL